MKMKGDYNRYLAEISSGTEDHQIVKKAAMDAYEKAHEEAVRTMPPVHPIRLGLALNYSVFHCEILSDVDKASYNFIVQVHHLLRSVYLWLGEFWLSALW